MSRDTSRRYTSSETPKPQNNNRRKKAFELIIVGALGTLLGSLMFYLISSLIPAPPVEVIFPDGISVTMQSEDISEYISIQAGRIYELQNALDEKTTQYNSLRTDYNSLVGTQNQQGRVDNSTYTESDTQGSAIADNIPLATVFLNNLDYFNIEHVGRSNQWYRYGVEAWSGINDRDNLGNTHANAVKFRLHGMWEGSSILKEYFIDSNYSTFDGSYSMLFQSRDSSGRTVFIVLGDGEVIYRSDPFGSDTLPTEFSIDITNVDRLGIQVHNAELHRDNWWVAILNPRLQ